MGNFNRYVMVNQSDQRQKSLKRVLCSEDISNKCQFTLNLTCSFKWTMHVLPVVGGSGEDYLFIGIKLFT